MKILTLNYHYGNNYGAVLEAYALQYFLYKYSNDVLCLNYVFKEGPLHKYYRRILKILTQHDIRIRYMSKLLTATNKEKRIETSVKKTYLQNDNMVFDEFRKKNLHITKQIFHGLGELRTFFNSHDVVDAVVCGSDVIWNVNNESLDTDVYFLGWVPDKVKRIAYAPSWGKPTIDLCYSAKQNISTLLSKFDAVSVREKSGVDICASLGRKDAQWVPDPTMLLTAGAWNKIAENKFHGRYILNYRIPYNKSVDDSAILYALTQHYQIDVKKVPDIESEYVWLSPTEWLGGIRDAEFIITNSFHGVVFCIIYNKNFLFTKLVGDYEKLNERIYSLLDLFDLSDRIITEETASNASIIKSLIKSPINWDQVNEKLKQWRQVGVDFLDKALKTANVKKK